MLGSDVPTCWSGLLNRHNSWWRRHSGELCFSRSVVTDWDDLIVDVHEKTTTIEISILCTPLLNRWATRLVATVSAAPMVVKEHRHNTIFTRRCLGWRSLFCLAWLGLWQCERSYGLCRLREFFRCYACVGYRSDYFPSWF